MEAGGWVLVAAAALLGASHTALGPDHTLPFVMLARARRWSRRRTMAITGLCGLGHVASALLLAGAGLLVGGLLVDLPSYRAWLDRADALRGGLAGWGFVALGAAYGLSGVRRAIRGRAELEPHEHDGDVHIHRRGRHAHVHAEDSGSRTTFWMLFALLVLGPCEPLIVLFLPLAAAGRWSALAAAAAAFGAATVLTMLGLVGLAHSGLARLPLGPLERWSHAMAGGVIASCGLAVVFLSL